jgi:hypothetical protein
MKMALNLIEGVTTPKKNTDSRKRKRSEESGSRSGSVSQFGSGPQQLRSSRHNEPPRSPSRGTGCGAPHAGSSYGFGYGSGYGSGHGSNRYYNPSYYPHQSRGRAGLFSSRGTTEVGGNTGEADRGRNNRGYRGGGGPGGGGLPRGRPWPRW